MTTIDTELLHKNMEHEEGLQDIKYYFIKLTEILLFYLLHFEKYKVDFREQCVTNNVYRWTLYSIKLFRQTQLL